MTKLYEQNPLKVLFSNSTSAKH